MKEKKIKKVKLNFDELEAWTDPTQDDIPVCSFIAVYKASGLMKAIENYVKKNPGFQVCALDNIFANFYTIKRLKNLIEDNWKSRELMIDGDNHVYWDTSRYPKGATHYPKKPKAIVRNCINIDFANYCPGLDDDLEDDVLVFKIYLPDEEKKEEGKTDGQN